MLKFLARFLRWEAGKLDPQTPPLLVTCSNADAVTVPQCGSRYLLMTDGNTVANYPITSAEDARRLMMQLAAMEDSLFREEIARLGRRRHASPSAN